MSCSKQQRVLADITQIAHPVSFKGKQHTLNIIQTSGGDFLARSIHCVKILINTEDTAIACGHFNTLSKRTPVLQHGNKKLEDHTKELKDGTYINGKVIYLTRMGLVELAQKSNHAEAIKNKEEFLQLIEDLYAHFHSTSTDNASKTYDGKKKARVDDDGASAVSVDEDAAAFDTLDEMQIDETQDLQQMVPLLHARSDAELKLNQVIAARYNVKLQHMQKVNSETLAHEQKINAEATQRMKRDNAELLLQKDAMQKLIDIENEKKLKFEDRRLKQEHEKRMISDIEYMRMHLQQAEAARAEKDKEELKKMQLAEAAEAKAKAEKAEELQRAEAAEKKAKAEKDEEQQRADAAEQKTKAEKEEAELKAKTAARSIKAAATRRKRAAAKDLKDKLYEYGAATIGRARLLLLPALNEALKETMPDDADRSNYIKSLDAVEPVEIVGKGGVYVISYEGKTHSRYVGYSKNISKRIAQHRSGVGGAKCLEGATNIKKLQTDTVGSMDQLDAWERREVLAQMRKRGIDNVRGWHYVSKDQHSASDRREAIKNICSDNNLCVRCGATNHYAGACTGKAIAEWMR